MTYSQGGKKSENLPSLMGGHAKKITLSTLPVDAVGPADEEEELDDEGSLLWRSTG